jgi:hypothetical protein
VILRKALDYELRARSDAVTGIVALDAGAAWRRRSSAILRVSSSFTCARRAAGAGLLFAEAVLAES